MSDTTVHCTHTTDGSVCDACLDSSTTITAREFVEDGYAEKIKAGECEVIWPNSDSRVESVIPEKDFYRITWYQIGGIGRPSSLEGRDEPLTVRWLTPATISIADAVERQHEIHERLKAEIDAGLQAEADYHAAFDAPAPELPPLPAEWRFNAEDQNYEYLCKPKGYPAFWYPGALILSDGSLSISYHWNVSEFPTLQAILAHAAALAKLGKG